jgi:hypothetical protein
MTGLQQPRSCQVWLPSTYPRQRSINSSFTRVASTCAKHSNHKILTQMLLRDLLLGIQMDTTSWVVHHRFVQQGGVHVR